MAAVWALGSNDDPRPIDPTDKYVLQAIADSANDNGCHSYNSEPTLATKTSLGLRAVRYALQHLERHHAITVDRQGSERGTNLYTVHLDRYEPCTVGRSRCLKIGKHRPGVATDATPPAAEGVATDATPPGNRFLPGVATDATDPSVDPSLNQKPNPMSRKRDRAAGLASTDVHRVFDAWREVTGKQRAKLDPKRRKLIGAALHLGYTVEELCLAVTGWAFSPHHRGENDRRTVYNDLGLLLRDADHIDQFLALAEDRGKPRKAAAEPAAPSYAHDPRPHPGHDPADCGLCVKARKDATGPPAETAQQPAREA
jgi:hypothetical protein